MSFRNLCLAAALSALSVAALAAEPANQTVPPDAAAGASAADAAGFNTLDLDQDGFISRDEARGTNLEKRFDALDVDHDGRLAPSEVNAGSPAAGAGSTAAPE